MKKLLFAVFLFISCTVMAGMPDVKCPADRPLADWKGNCYSCDEDKELFPLNGSCEEVCPNRMNLSMPLPVPGDGGCVLDTPGNRITNFTTYYYASLFGAFIPLFIVMLSLLWVAIRWTCERIKSKILTFSLWGVAIVGVILLGEPDIIPISLVCVYCFCLYYSLWHVYNTIREVRSKDKKIRKKAIKVLVILGVYGILLGLLAIVTPFFALTLFNILVPIYTACLFAKKEKQRKGKK